MVVPKMARGVWARTLCGELPCGKKVLASGWQPGGLTVPCPGSLDLSTNGPEAASRIFQTNESRASDHGNDLGGGPMQGKFVLRD